MGSVSIYHWLVVLVALGLILLAVGFPVARILKRMGLSPWWTVLALIPYLNVVALWIVAFVRWPKVDGDAV